MAPLYINLPIDVRLAWQKLTFHLIPETSRTTNPILLNRVKSYHNKQKDVVWQTAFCKFLNKLCELLFLNSAQWLVSFPFFIFSCELAFFTSIMFLFLYDMFHAYLHRGTNLRLELLKLPCLSITNLSLIIYWLLSFVLLKQQIVMKRHWHALAWGKFEQKTANYAKVMDID